MSLNAYISKLFNLFKTCFLLPILVMSACNFKNSPFQNKHLSIQNDTVFFDDQIIEGADPQTFSSISNYYSKDKSAIYFHDFYRNAQDYYLTKTYQIAKLEGVDSSHFEVIGDHYASDQKSVFYQGLKLENADVATFRQVDKKFYADRFRVYFFGEPIKQANGETFHSLGHNYYADDKLVWVFPQIQPLSIPVKDTIMALGVYYLKGANHVYFIDGNKEKNVRVISDVAKHFEVIDDEFKYGRTDEFVYYKDSILIGADPKTFKCGFTEQTFEGIHAEAQDTLYFYRDGKRLN